MAKLAKWVLTHSAEQEKALIRRPKSNPSPPPIVAPWQHVESTRKRVEDVVWARHAGSQRRGLGPCCEYEAGDVDRFVTRLPHGLPSLVTIRHARTTA